MERDIKGIVSQMLPEEKAAMCSGLDFWHTKPIERLGIPSIMMTDGPHGLRKQVKDADNLGIHDSVPSTCFPPAAAMACSWDRKLIEQLGIALGEECQAENVAILLGPGANIKRSPLCGRNFEYFSEDPYLSSEMAANHITGVQSQGVGTSLKHFAANNQEYMRMLTDAVVDERTLREIYLASFEGAVKQSQPWTVMCAYNKVNGSYCSENHYLLTEILKKEWKHQGFVVSDWGAVNDRVAGLAAGMELEMPFSGGERDRMIMEAVQSGELREAVLDNAVERILSVIFKAVDSKKENVSYDIAGHHTFARKAARESMVLLKNEEALLPLKMQGTVAIIGDFARNPRYQGCGSSHINPTIVDDPYTEIESVTDGKVKILYAQGYRADGETGIFSAHEFKSNSDKADYALIDEAKAAAITADAAIVFAGLPGSYESEGFDRKHLGMPEGHNQLIEAVASVQKNTIVVLCNGSPVEMPWLDKVKGVLEGHLGGQAFGGAIADLLFGLANPCGKLAETFPKELKDNPSFLNFPGEKSKVEYREGLFVGYRYYDKKNLQPLFPFGYGLSYTTFEYSGMVIDKSVMKDSDVLTVTVKVKNTGSMAGKEIVQLYVRDMESSVTRPQKELKGFEKIYLEPGEEQRVTFALDKRAFAYYHTGIGDWHVETGDFEILVGKSVCEILLSGKVTVLSTPSEEKQFTRNTTLAEIIADPVKKKLLKEELETVLRVFGFSSDGDIDIKASIFNLPLRTLVSFIPSVFTEKKLKDILDKLNAH